MPLSPTFGWLDIDRIAEALHAAHPGANPIALRFTDLRRMVEALPNFKPDPAHPVNERILETIQSRWLEEREDAVEDGED